MHLFSAAKEMMSTRIVGHKKVGNQLVAIYDDSTEDSIDMGPVTGSIPVSTMQEQITAEQEARARDTAKLARDTAEREAGRQRLNAEEAARAKEYESERRRLAAGRLPEPDAR
jgi:hypothetical protein